MGILYDYFTSPDDRAAAAAFGEGPVDAGFDTLSVKGIDPHIQLGRAVALLVDASFSQVTADARFCALVTDPEAESMWIVTLPDGLRDALAEAPSRRLAEVAVPWAAAEEFHGDGDPAHLTAFLEQFADLARRARSRDHRLYCSIVL